MINRFFLVFLFSSFGLNAIAAQPADSALMLADEVAAIVGNSTILLSDIESTTQMVRKQRKELGTLSERSEKEEAFELLLTQHLLAQQAKLDSLDKELHPTDDIVEQQADQMIAEAGGLKALERKTGKPIYQIKADLARDVQQMQLAQLMERTVRSKVKLNYSDVAKFVKDISTDSIQLVPVQYSYSQIVKIPPQTDERKYAIRERLLEFRRRVLAGEKLAVLARLYSADGSAPRGGEIGPQDIRTFVAPFQEALQNLKPNQVSEIVETEYGYHIIELISLKDNMVHFRHLLLKPEFTVEESRKVSAELDSIAGEIRAGRLDMSSAALRFSDDKMTKENGGKAFNQNGYIQSGDIRTTSSRYMEDELYPVDYQELKDLKVGEVSNSYEAMDEKGNVVYKIVYMDAILPPHHANIVDDYDVLEQIALESRQNEVMNEWVNKTIPKMFIEIMPAYRGYHFERKGWVR